MRGKFTPEGLPVLTKETVQMHYLEERRLDAGSETNLMTTLETRAREIFGENPVLESALNRFCKQYGFTRVEEMGVRAAGVYVYQLMKRQAEINRLENDNK